MGLLWAAVAAYIVYAASSARAHRAARTVTGLRIEVADSSSQGHLVASAQVREWLRRSGIPTVGEPVAAVNLAAIEELVARNGFVAGVNAYVDYGGELRIDIRQRRPVLRLLTEGMNSYVTAEGYVFPAPRASSLYVPVVTGAYRSPFPATYAGSVRAYIDEELQQIDRNIARIEREKYPYYRRERANDENLRALRRMRIKKGWFEKEEAFDRRVQALREKNALLRRRYRYEQQCIEEGIAAVERQQDAERRKQKKLEKTYEDFCKLITFVKFVERDDFWRSEVVQILASTSASGAVEVTLIPRSGDYAILFGRLEDVERKFDKLLRFYRSGLRRIGWDRYRTIDIRYAEQVVCKR